jgi:hypothetical protein
MKLEITVRQLKSGCGERAKARFDPSFHQIDDASEAPLS